MRLRFLPSPYPLLYEFERFPNKSNATTKQNKCFKEKQQQEYREKMQKRKNKRSLKTKHIQHPKSVSNLCIIHNEPSPVNASRNIDPAKALQGASTGNTIREIIQRQAHPTILTQC